MMMVLQLLYVLFFVLLFTLIAVSLYYDHKLKIPPAPTLPWVRRRIISALKTHLTKDNPTIIELGSGWGGLSFSIARNFPKAQVLGYELSPFPFWFSKWREIFGTRVHFTRGDIFDQDLSGADAVVYYLSPVVAERLAAKFKAELKPGTVIVSNAFALPGFDQADILETNIGVKIRVYVYRV